MILRARIVAPISRPPIENGVVSLTGDRLAWVGPYAELPAGHRHGQELDMGDVALLPGLINAHCHLDYTDMAGQIPPPKGFTAWIQAMVGIKSGWNLEQYDASWRRGAAMLLRTGTTTVLDVEAVPELLPQMWEATPLRVISLRELIHVNNRRSARELVESAVNDWLGLPGSAARVGLSPHAPYTTSRELLEEAARAAHRRSWPLATHVAESEEEFEMFMYRHGPMFDWLKGQRDMSDCGKGSPVVHLERCGYLENNLMAIHVNYLWRHDAGILARNGVSVVHCPRSHDYFRHLRFPLEEFERAGVNICLGTDSLATMRAESGIELNLFAEMNAFSRQHPDVPPEEILRLATMNGARALGRAGELGELAPGACADLITVPFTGETSLLEEALVAHAGPVTHSMIAGNWAI